MADPERAGESVCGWCGKPTHTVSDQSVMHLDCFKEKYPSYPVVSGVAATDESSTSGPER